MSLDSESPASSPRRALRLGLTGGIGSGKSTVAALLVQHGAVLVDLDAIAHALTAVGGAALAPLAASFGLDVLAPTGALKRDKLRALVYAQPEQRQRLEAILHPMIRQEAERQAQAAEQGGAPLVLFDVPLLAEHGATWRPRLDRVLVVDCPPSVQLHRVMQRNGWSAEQVQAVIDAQAPRAKRLVVADWVLANGESSTLQDLQQSVAQLAQRLGLRQGPRYDSGLVSGSPA